MDSILPDLQRAVPRLWQIELQLDREIVSKRDQTFMRARTGFKLNILMALDIFDTAIDMKPDTVSPFVCAWLLYNCKISAIDICHC